ncbi:hypothetical protein F511_23645 [Dorcoceras hygrometricum]|uniref:Uncharacterized protein n=1 Tax=Dorcoceras hygrometricum TaxID=472368 RepID=A0A2Z7D8E4_9LAMI|nr:hypothetical protein F511_23645 [Dorcoceras hygrometricum]
MYFAAKNRSGREVEGGVERKGDLGVGGESRLLPCFPWLRVGMRGPGMAGSDLWAKHGFVEGGRVLYGLGSGPEGLGRGLRVIHGIFEGLVECWSREKGLIRSGVSSLSQNCSCARPVGLRASLWSPQTYFLKIRFVPAAIPSS